PAGPNASGEVVAATGEAVDAYVHSAHLRHVALVGHSLGGEMAIMIGARHPSDVDKILIVDSLPFLGEMFGPPGTTPQTIGPIATSFRDKTRSQSADAYAASEKQFIAYLTKTEAVRSELTRQAVMSDQAVVAQALYDL